MCAPLPVSTRRPIPRSDRFCTVLTRWVSVRASRSSFQTMRTSPSRNDFRQAARPGRSSRLPDARSSRSEEHTSELQSLMRISYAVFCLKKKKQKNTNKTHHIHTQITSHEKTYNSTQQQMNHTIS